MLTLILNIESATTYENQRVILKSLLISYFIIKTNESGEE